MKKTRFVAGALFFVLAACAVITVNIYFPEKDVKEAYKALEKELMTPGKTNETPVKKPEGKPESFFRFELVSSAWAQEAGMAGNITDIVRKMPDVVNAYKEMGARVSDTDRLRDGGLVGEGKDGLLAVRGSISPADQKIVDMENANRRTVINGMAKAIIRINRAQETPDNLRQVMPQAAEQFASIRRDTAKKGWLVQDARGNWGKK